MPINYTLPGVYPRTGGGNQHHIQPKYGRKWSIPARAGETKAGRGKSRKPGVYPRTGGGNRRRRN